MCLWMVSPLPHPFSHTLRTTTMGWSYHGHQYVARVTMRHIHLQLRHHLTL